MPSVISGDANVSATEFGYLDGVTSGLQSQIDSKLNLAGGKILQIVRATDGTGRSTTSTSYGDLGTLSVTITPQRNDSAVLLLAQFHLETNSTTTGSHASLFQITDSSNNAISGAEGQVVGNVNYSFSGTAIHVASVTLIARATPATTSATTYKVRFRSEVSTTTTFIRNNLTTGQLYAIEVSA